MISASSTLHISPHSHIHQILCFASYQVHYSFFDRRSSIDSQIHASRYLDSTSVLHITSMPLGNLVRLIHLELEEIPVHQSIVKYLNNSSQPPQSNASKPASSSPDGTSPNTDIKKQPDLKQFIKAILDEATNFVDHEIPTSFKKKGTKSNPPASAKIDLLQRMISSEEIKRIPFQEANVSRKASKAEESNGEAW